MPAETQPPEPEMDPAAKLERLQTLVDEVTEINKPERMAEVGREDGGTKLVHCCERCAEDLFDGRLFSFYGALEEGDP